MFDGVDEEVEGVLGSMVAIGRCNRRRSETVRLAVEADVFRSRCSVEYESSGARLTGLLVSTLSSFLLDSALIFGVWADVFSVILMEV